MLWLDADPEMRRAEAAGVAGWAAGLQRPELADFREVRGPVVNAGVEDWSEHGVLPDVRIEGAKQFRDAGVAAEAFVESGHVRRKFEWRT